MRYKVECFDEVLNPQCPQNKLSAKIDQCLVGRTAGCLAVSGPFPCSSFSGTMPENFATVGGHLHRTCNRGRFRGESAQDSTGADN